MPRADGLRGGQPAALEVLLRGGSTREAAEAAGVDPRTVRRWKNDAGPFKDSLDEHSTAALEDLRLQITLALEDAVNESRATLKDPKAPRSVRMQAVASILQIARSLDVLKGDTGTVGPQLTPEEWRKGKKEDLPL